MIYIYIVEYDKAIRIHKLQVQTIVRRNLTNITWEKEARPKRVYTIHCMIQWKKVQHQVNLIDGIKDQDSGYSCLRKRCLEGGTEGLLEELVVLLPRMFIGLYSFWRLHWAVYLWFACFWECMSHVNKIYVKNNYIYKIPLHNLQVYISV